MTISELITLAGGADAISIASRRAHKPVSVDAVHKWRRNGIPDGHWPIFIAAGASAQVLFEANEALRRSRAKGRKVA